jgi:molecular chaperone DnaK
METINFGIDLGTTNSGIARYDNGRIAVLKNPVGLKELLPSVVSFYKGRTLIGDKAREQYLSNSGNVFSAFKRKMGTDEKYVASISGNPLELSPIDLSTHVLRELKNFVPGEEIKAAVVTIPASFDTVQSNATKLAASEAGFSEIVLLQEPIAACLAYANTSNLNIETEQRWLVYDFGGGTFDAALVYINRRELKVIDNKGNNFLGGTDIDYAFIEEIITPRLVGHMGDARLGEKLLSKEGVYGKLWYYLNYLAEEAKKQLSVAPSTWIDIEFPELDLSIEIEITREQFNRVVKPKYFETEQFLLDLLKNNNITFSQIDRIILVGGTTYIPYIRESLKTLSGSLIDDSIDPGTAVIIGAAYYAGAFPLSLSSAQNEPKKQETAGNISFKLSFETYTNDLEELIAFKAEKLFSGSYRIARNDGGFDTGWQHFEQTASEFVTLLPKAKNMFKLTIADRKGEAIYTRDDIIITHGLYSVLGQLLPEDICLEVDGDGNKTYLEVIFKRNEILPLSRTVYKTFSKSIARNSDDKLLINIVEGKGGSLPGANLSIGYIEISGKQLEGDLVKGTDVELLIEIDESRGLKVEVYVPATLQQITQSFHIAQREASPEKILQDIARAEMTIKKEIDESDEAEAYEISAMFQDIGEQLQKIKWRMHAIKNDKATEEKYRIDEQKRKLLARLDDLTRARDTYIEISKYSDEKEIYLMREKWATEEQKRVINKMFSQEKDFLNSVDKYVIRQNTEELKKLNEKISLQNDERFISIFFSMIMCPETCFKNLTNFEDIKQTGINAANSSNLAVVRQLVMTLYNNMVPECKKNFTRNEKNDLDQTTPGITKTGLK